MANLNYLGIDKDELEQVIDLCEDCLDEFRIGTDGFENQMYEYLKENGNWENITNSIMEAYMETTAAFLQDKYPEMEVETYINGGDTHLYINNLEYHFGDEKDDFFDEPQYIIVNECAIDENELKEISGAISDIVTNVADDDFSPAPDIGVEISVNDDFEGFIDEVNRMNGGELDGIYENWLAESNDSIADFQLYDIESGEELGEVHSITLSDIADGNITLDDIKESEGLQSRIEEILQNAINDVYESVENDLEGHKKDKSDVDRD